jgi:L-methionine (R)-S-oxide reductase
MGRHDNPNLGITAQKFKEIPRAMSQPGGSNDELLHEFESYGRETADAKTFMQHIADRLHEAMTRYNWVGFYWMESPNFDALVCGPYAGSFTPTPRIPLDKGLCGAAATSGRTVVINDVKKDPRYLGSDLVKSNIVVPIFQKKRVMAELCIESYFVDAFPPAEQRFIESCAALVASFLLKSETHN